MTSGGLRATALTSCLASLVIAMAGCGWNPSQGSEPSEQQGAPEPIQQRWWNWATAEPTATNPVADPTGADCARNQPDDLWFFAGSFGGTVARKCMVPAGRPIVAPLVNQISNEESCAEFIRMASGYAELDGTPLPPERFEGEQIVYRGIEGNPVTETADEYEDTACGLWITIPPPASGEHRLRIEGVSGDFTVRADYTFEVTALS